MSAAEVVATEAGALKVGDTVNTAGAGASAPYWQQIKSIEPAGRVGGRVGSGHGADVYRVQWQGAEDNAAPSLLSSRQTYDVLKPARVTVEQLRAARPGVTCWSHDVAGFGWMKDARGAWRRVSTHDSGLALRSDDVYAITRGNCHLSDSAAG